MTIRRISERCHACARFASLLETRKLECSEVGNDEVGKAVRRTSAALLAVPLAASMLLAGCGGDSKPNASRSSTASSSPTTTAAPSTTSGSPTSTASPTTDPNIPAAARAHTPAGAEAFTRYFFERSNTAWTVPRAGILSPLCQSSAIACTALEKEADRLAREGHHYDGNPVTIKYIGVLDATNPNKYDVLANVVQERRSEIDRAGKIYATDKRKDLRFHFVLLYASQAWSVSSLKTVR